MRTKIGTLVAEELVRELKIRAATDGRKMNELIEEAIDRFLHHDPGMEERRKNTMRIMEDPIRLSTSDLKIIMEEDFYEQ